MSDVFAVVWILWLIWHINMIFLTFNNRINEQPSVGNKQVQESSKIMLFPVIILSFFAIFTGVLINPPIDLLIFEKHWFLYYQHHQILDINLLIVLVSSSLAVLGITMAWIFYKNRNITNTLFSKAAISKVLHKKWFFDDFYELIIVKQLFYRFITRIIQLFDDIFINQFSDFIGYFAKNLGRPIAIFQNGSVQFYGLILTIFYGLVVTLGVLFLYVIS